MKKILLKIAIIAGSFVVTNAATIDESTLKLDFEGYKTKDRVATIGSFNDVKYSLNKDTSSITSTFKGAKAIIDPNNVDMNVDEITNNIKNAFFKTLNKGAKFEVEIVNVVEGDNQGLLSGIVKIGKEKSNLPLSYTINESDFFAEGELDLSVFKNSSKALKALSDVAPGHAGFSWPLVKVTLSGKVK
ncbi:hypothetical protein [Helicobacter sp. MIT 14-3879]|uniref:hypothetical protein n=1 Tax=Helicobacter sp. MIT 14-3879 TaxID=2040649 RepID=UPI000E1E909E|nr:hypothetical protein [Helicobacter sp. MIT 14-3879]RDU62681.1 hypothetical protein CQA44_06755 [Helicobacter sp. MIT 14-3879]